MASRNREQVWQQHVSATNRLFRSIVVSSRLAAALRLSRGALAYQSPDVPAKAATQAAVMPAARDQGFSDAQSK